ncbi:glyoxalase/bleomycin resistance protein/dioxygenase superfamily protein [Sphingobium sp. AEW010]|nr:glyoxalase/bleomycin resistance protein/dioxygenase superfamily protein [Sphingobium sp. AEW010]TWD23310.1 glyoxalase/bleomycin resistance protein/dioxygenase superfamily protein [Sphingobium sp. AEW013]TWD25170.1 glyoxalase/bleomycin resistance protein/dioxygenase superfamily protein [Sphingobium sp. AEW001]
MAGSMSPPRCSNRAEYSDAMAGLSFGDPRQAEGVIVQTAFVVRDLAKAVQHWSATVGAGPFFRADLCVRSIFRGRPATSDVSLAVGYHGDMMIELVQPRSGDRNIYAEYLDARGEGLHHLQLHTADPDAAAARYAAAGCGTVSRSESADFGCSLFVDTLDQLGYYLEFGAYPTAITDLVEEFRQTHAAWNGSRPMRAYPPPARKTL